MKVKTLSAILVGRVLIGLLLILNALWMFWNWRAWHPVARNFKVSIFRTNDVEGVGLLDARTGQPIWIGWDFYHAGKPTTDSFFSEGKNVMNIFKSPGRPAIREVIFYGRDGRETVEWADRSGTGLFTERIFYEGGVPRLEVWYKNAWHVTEMREKRRGIRVDDRWVHLIITNGLWIPETQGID